MKEHTYQWDDVIIGYSLSALIYAFYTGHPVIGYGDSAPKTIDDLDKEIDYSAPLWSMLMFQMWWDRYMTTENISE